MKRITFVAITAVLAACGGAEVGSTTTTSASVREAEPAWSPSPLSGDSQMPFDVLDDEPAPINPRTQRDVDLAERASHVHDAKISADALDAIVHDAVLPPSAKHIHVSTRARLVTLYGHVRTRSERQEIVLKVLDVPGVRDVNDQIEIAP
jgi:hypothetical protein